MKTRILAGGVHSTKQQMVRIDKTTRLPDAQRGAPRACWRALRAYRGPLDGVLVSDYGFGLLDARRWWRRRSRSRGGARVPGDGGLALRAAAASAA